MWPSVHLYWGTISFTRVLLHVNVVQLFMKDFISMRSKMTVGFLLRIAWLYQKLFRFAFRSWDSRKELPICNWLNLAISHIFASLALYKIARTYCSRPLSPKKRRRKKQLLHLHFRFKKSLPSPKLLSLLMLTYWGIYNTSVVHFRNELMFDRLEYCS